MRIQRASLTMVSALMFVSVCNWRPACAQALSSSMASPTSTVSAPKPALKLPARIPLKRRMFLRNNDFQIWSPVYIWYRKDRLRTMMEVNPRVGVGEGELDQLLVRPAVGFQLKKRVSLWQGYCWAGNWLPRYVSENRIFQQVLVENRFKHWGMVNRTRLEERYIEHVEDTAMRLRHFVRVSVPLGPESPWQLVGQEELFINLNKAANNITPGINQNRVFLGVNRRLHPKLNVDFGYQYQYINRNAPTLDRHNHILMINTYYTL